MQAYLARHVQPRRLAILQFLVETIIAHLAICAESAAKSRLAVDMSARFGRGHKVLEAGGRYYSMHGAVTPPAVCSE
jgi:hypothetical protein